MLQRRLPMAMLLGGCAALLLSAGCTRAKSQDNRAANGIMTVLGLEYGDYLASNRNAPPADLAQFRTFVESRADKLTEYRVTNVDDLFTSPRDGQSIKIVCGVKEPVVDGGGYGLAAYEAAGVDGKRLIANIRGGVSEMTADEFAQAFPGLTP